MKKSKYIFDVDGTITPSRKKIQDDFGSSFLTFCRNYDVYLVTGSDREKTVEQVGLDICHTAKRLYNCSGSDVYEKDVNVYRSDWTLPEDVREFLQEELDSSKFPIRTGLHFEARPGGLNFSILGRGSGVNHVERDEYVKWDINTGEREKIANKIKNNFPDIEVNIGGETGMDLGAPGSNKSQILRDFGTDDKLYFYGDMMKEGQNDYPLAKAIRDRDLGEAFHVKDYKHTWELLDYQTS